MKSENVDSLLAEPLQTEALPAFSRDDMVNCRACSRKNPPNRTKCIYCGGGLDVEIGNIARVRLLHRKLETLEKGWNVVLRPNSEASKPSVISKLAGDLTLDEEFARRALNQRLPLPIVRVEDEKEALLYTEKIKTFGLESIVISDEKLNAGTRPRRLREIRFLEHELEFIDFNTMQSTSVNPNKLRMIVTGRILTDTSEKLEKRKRGKSEAVEEFESNREEPVVDLYTDDEIGYRVYSSGFDFSCLGAAKTNIAGENCDRLVERILDAHPSAKLVDSYSGIRSLLSDVWGVDQSTEFLGPQRSGLMSAESKRKITRSNFTQFTKFSRLQNLIG